MTPPERLHDFARYFFLPWVKAGAPRGSAEEAKMCRAAVAYRLGDLEPEVMFGLLAEHVQHKDIPPPDFRDRAGAFARLLFSLDGADREELSAAFELGRAVVLGPFLSTSGTVRRSRALSENFVERVRRIVPLEAGAAWRREPSGSEPVVERTEREPRARPDTEPTSGSEPDFAGRDGFGYSRRSIPVTTPRADLRPPPKASEPPPVAKPSVVPKRLPPLERVDRSEGVLGHRWPEIAARVEDALDPEGAAWSGVSGTLTALTGRLDTAAEQRRRAGFAFDDARTDDARLVLTARDAPVPDTWFVGDLHGDVLAWEAIEAYATAVSAADGRTATLVLLGDVVDDGAHGPDLVLRIFERLVRHPEHTCWLVGNHDESVGWDPTKACFRAMVDPGEFAAQLNARGAEQPEMLRLGRLFMRLVADYLPRALLFPDGTLVSHAGFPLRDLWPDLRAARDFESPRALQDFAWTRMSDRLPRKQPNRSSRGSEFGYEDLAEFCRHAETLLDRPVRRLVRGHDHIAEPDRVSYPAKYAAAPILTLNSMSWTLPRETLAAGYAGLPWERAPCIARWNSGAIPTVHRIAIPAALVERWHPRGGVGE